MKHIILGAGGAVADSSKFERRFGLQPTPYATGIAETAQVYKDR